jgi:GMP synthase-like glutamine amidotransferase
MQILLLKHIDCEGAYKISDWARERQHSVTTIALNHQENLPLTTDAVDFLIVMGGPMGVHDEAKYPWLKAEKRFISQAIEANIPILGICLGSQLIAHVLKASVYKGEEKEIGWFPVFKSPIPSGSPAVFSDFPEQFTPFHWHGDTFDLPDGAIRLIENAVYPNQAFQFKENIIGLQFHLESTPKSVSLLTQQFSAEITTGCYQQSIEAMRATTQHFDVLHPLLYAILDYLTVTPIL